MNNHSTAPTLDLRGFDIPAHGGDLLLASRLSARPPQDILDFSVSVNPLGLPECVQPLIGQIMSDLKRYPDSESSALKQALANKLVIDKNHITITNGSTEFIYMLPELLGRNKSVLCIEPCFSEYERAFKMADMQVYEYILTPDTAFQADIDSLLNRVGAINNLGGIVLGNPNNPTGTMWKRDHLDELLRYCTKREIYLIVDETFIEFAGWQHSLVKEIEQSKFLILVQSLTKFYALAGLRIGHGITSKPLADKIRSIRPPWSVNSPAQTIGIAVLNDFEYQRHSREFIQTETTHFLQQLSAIPTIEVFASHANFMLLRLINSDKDRGHELYTNLLQDGILTRNCSNFKGLNPNFFRVAVKQRHENELLLAKLKAQILSLES